MEPTIDQDQLDAWRAQSKLDQQRATEQDDIVMLQFAVCFSWLQCRQMALNALVLRICRIV